MSCSFVIIYKVKVGDVEVLTVFVELRKADQVFEIWVSQINLWVNKLEVSEVLVSVSVKVTLHFE